MKKEWNRETGEFYRLESRFSILYQKIYSQSTHFVTSVSHLSVFEIEIHAELIDFRQILVYWWIVSPNEVFPCVKVC